MIQPVELTSTRPYGPWGCRGRDIWQAMQAAAAGDAPALRKLLNRDPNLYRAEYWYTQPLHVAVREGHAEAVRVLLHAGANPTAVIGGDTLISVARDRGYEVVARLLEDVAKEQGVPSLVDHPVHLGIDAGDAARVEDLLRAGPQLVHVRDRSGATPLHRAVAASKHELVRILLDHGADIHALCGAGAASVHGYAAPDFQPIDLALWNGFWGVRGDTTMAQMLLARGAQYDLVIASALGDLKHVEHLLDHGAEDVGYTRPCGKHALSAAADFGHLDAVRFLLDRGANPNWPDGPTAPGGTALHAAARHGNDALVALLLAHGADPNGYIDSSGSATFAAKTPELRKHLIAHGGTLSAHDLIWLGENEEAVQRVQANPREALNGCGGVLAAACELDNHELVVRLLDAGARVPPVLTGCRSYLLRSPGLLRLLLSRGMNPDLPNWLNATPLHDLCGLDGRGRPRPHRVQCARMLLDAGANIHARDDEFRSTPLAWAARNNLLDMVELLLSRGAATSLPDDRPWATPLAWASRRGHARIVDKLHSNDATV